MAESIVFDLTVRVLEFLGQSAFERIAPYFGGRDRLNELQETMEMIQARLYDAEKRQEAEEGQLIRSWLQRLKRVMYRLEDLLEEVDIADKQDKQMAPGKLTKTVCFLPSMLGSLKMNKRLFHEAQDIMRELDRIKSDMDRFHFNVCPIHQERGASNMINGREETYSFIREEEVIGRDEDKNVILRMVLECDNVEEDLSVIPIFGMGGLGKTTLAQLIYNDKTVERHFELKSWACISDQICSFDELAWKVLHSITGKERECLIAKEPVGKVLHSMTGEESKCLSAEQLQSHLREAVNGKKFLLVLDDVWDQNRETWLRLKSLLRGGKQGSKILVTTRSEVVASNMGTIKPYLLGTLPEEKSWALFKSLAFKDGQEATNPKLTGIGKEIVKKCGNVPLAIRTIAGLLYSRDTEEDWVHFRDKTIGMIEQTQTGIMRTLKISYDHLLPQQKQCFAYCSLFPKDYTFGIKRLIQLWMAQGFVKSMDDGYIHFMELLRRCFFQNVSRGDWDISGVWDSSKTCQMHDLMHDLALMVGNECLIVDGSRENVGNNIKHVNIVNPSGLGSQARSWLSASQPIRSYFTTFSKSVHNLKFSSLRHIRALDFGSAAVELPSAIGELKHLRYLRATIFNHQLPKEITKLPYLQTLDLKGYGWPGGTLGLPSNFCKLTSLEHLRILDPNVAIYGPKLDMPPRFGELISLQSLDVFVVGKNGLDALSGMNLAGELRIIYSKQRQSGILEAMKANLKGKKLTNLELEFCSRESITDADKLLECLQLPWTLKSLNIRGWEGVRFPNWGIDQLPNLVSITINWCIRCRHLPSFSGLPHIKELSIDSCEQLDLWEVKNEDGDISDGGKDNSAMSSTWECLKSLNSLCVGGMSKLQSLPSGIGGITTLQKLSILSLVNLRTLPFSIGLLTQLRVLQIEECPHLEALPTSIQNLAALQELRIYRCRLLETRCEEPDGVDWPLIQHIPCKAISRNVGPLLNKVLRMKRRS